MKQIQQCLDKAIDNKMPAASKKWKAFRGNMIWADSEDVEDKEEHIILYHYHHLVLVYNLKTNEPIFEWYEKPTDKRGLDAAKEYLNKRFNNDPTLTE